MAKWSLYSLGACVLYALTGTVFALLVKTSHVDGKSQYHPVVLTLSIELVKFLLALPLVLSNRMHGETMAKRAQTVWDSRKLSIQLAIPAVCYAVYNYLSFVNLELVAPPTYRVMITSKVLYSGLLLPYFTDSVLSRRQWVGLVLLFIGCCVEQLGSFNIHTGQLALVLLSLQALCSAFAGVYFQRIQGSVKDLWLPNTFLYFWSILLAVGVLLAVEPEQLTVFGNIVSNISEHKTFAAIVLVNALGGFCTSVIIKYLDVIVKEYANFFDMLLTAGVSWYALNTPLPATLGVSFALVMLSLYLYNIKPEAESGKSLPLPAKATSETASSASANV